MLICLYSNSSDGNLLLICHEISFLIFLFEPKPIGYIAISNFCRIFETIEFREKNKYTFLSKIKFSTKNFSYNFPLISIVSKISVNSSTHQFFRYEEALDDFKSVQLEKQNTESRCRDELRELETNCKDRLSIFEEIHCRFIDRELEIGESLEGQFSPKKIQFLMRRQERRIKNSIKIRVKYLKLKNLLERINNDCDRLNNYGEDQTVNVYTNLLTVRNTLPERLDDREEEVGRLREKIFKMAPVSKFLKYDMIKYQQRKYIKPKYRKRKYLKPSNIDSKVILTMH